MPVMPSHPTDTTLSAVEFYSGSRNKRRHMITIQQARKLYERYVEAWKPGAEEQRATIVAEVFSEELQYLTPEFTGGIEAVLEDMAGFQKKFPGAHFEVEDASVHHDVALFT